jgi:putative protease
MPQPLPHQKEQNIPELLAPAGSPLALRAAIAAGADAVYVGGKRFGARNYAQNFTAHELEDAVSYAHTHGVRVYATVNTLVHDRELADAAEYLIWLYSIGIDAVLVQDIGVASLARTIVPELPLHASTQMTIHNTEGVLFAADLGFARVVLSRELSLAEVKDIARETAKSGIGLEVFVHGALCYSYSGQCLLSSVIGGRSGNRGMCAQPCRKPYVLVSGEPDMYGRPATLREIPLPGRYLLSPKDLCTLQDLDRLAQSPLISLKIEGRMKSPEYVAIVVSVYRKALDAIASGTWTPYDADMQDLALAFNRGFTSGYLFGERHGTLMGRDQPDNRGLLIGEVTGFDKCSREATIRPTIRTQLSPGDGLVFRNPDFPDKEYGFSLNTRPRHKNGVIRLAVPGPVRRGDRVYLTSSADLTRRAHRIIATPPFVLRHPIPLDLSVRISGEGRTILEGGIETGMGDTVRVTCTSEVRFSPDSTRPLTIEQITTQLKKTGGTPFALRNITIDYDGKMFAPLSELNRMRREFLALAQEELISSFRPSREDVGQARSQWATAASGMKKRRMTTGNSRSEKLEISVYADSIGIAGGAAAAGCDRIYFEPDITADACPCRSMNTIASVEDQLRSVLAICTKAGIPLVWKLPRILRDPELATILPVLSALHNEGLAGCMVESAGAADAVKRTVPGMKIFGSAGLNIFNHLAVRTLASRFYLLTISPELSGAEIRDLIRRTRADPCDTLLELVVQGCTEAMVSEDCILQPLLECKKDSPQKVTSRAFFGIRDSTGRTFPVRTDGSCRTHVFNAAETCLIDHIPSVAQMGVDSVAIDARGRTKAYAAQMVDIYRHAIPEAQRDITAAKERLIPLKKQAQEMALSGITGSHFIKGLKKSHIP